MEHDLSFSDWVRELRGSDQPEIAKLAAYFDAATSAVIEYAGKEIELARALGDGRRRSPGW